MYYVGLPASSIKPLQLIQNAAARLIFNEPERMKNVTPLFVNLHWLPVAARIKFKALVFAYKTTSGSAHLHLNSLLQSYVPLEASILQVNVALLFIPKRHKITFTDFCIKFSVLMTCPTQSQQPSPAQKHISSIFIWPSNSSTLYSKTLPYPAHMVLILFVQVLKKVLKS